MGFWDSFQVYNQKKHSDPRMFGGNHSNTGEGRTSYLYSSEYREPKAGKQETVEAKGMILDGGNLVNMRKTSVSSESSDTSAAGEGAMGMQNPNMVDISKLSAGEFKKLYDSMKKGEPDNRVNF